MNLCIVSASEAVCARVIEATPASWTTDCLSKWTAFVKQTYDLVILHEQAIGGALWTVVSDVKARGITVVGVLSDQPSIDGLLDLTRYQLQGYGNSHMSAPLMAQFLKTLGDGQTWFPPPLMQQALALASQALDGRRKAAEVLENLSPRERDIAADVANGLSNKEIAAIRNITEPTVKTHLTRIFAKVGVDSRVTLALLVKSAN